MWEGWIKRGGLRLEVGNDGLTHFLDALQLYGGTARGQGLSKPEEGWS